jgi:hypothetical protein
MKVNNTISKKEIPILNTKLLKDCIYIYKNMHKVAILIYGLNRSINITFPSIHDKILRILIENDVTYDFYIHTYKLKGTYSNIRNGEKSLHINPYEIQKYISPIDIIIHDQDKIDKLHNIKNYNKYGDPWSNKYVSLWNLIRALYSLKCAWQLIENKEYDGVIVLRPDVLFLNELNIHDFFNAIKNDEIYVPAFHDSSTSYNDRFAFGSKKSMAKYCTRYDHMKEYAAKQQLHSETFLKYVIKTAKKTNIKFNRIRANGKTDKRDL